MIFIDQRPNMVAMARRLPAACCFTMLHSSMKMPLNQEKMIIMKHKNNVVVDYDETSCSSFVLENTSSHAHEQREEVEPHKETQQEACTAVTTTTPSIPAMLLHDLNGVVPQQQKKPQPQQQLQAAGGGGEEDDSQLVLPVGMIVVCCDMPEEEHNVEDDDDDITVLTESWQEEEDHPAPVCMSLLKGTMEKIPSLDKDDDNDDDDIQDETENVKVWSACWTVRYDDDETNKDDDDTVENRDDDDSQSSSSNTMDDEDETSLADNDYDNEEQDNLSTCIYKLQHFLDVTLPFGCDDDYDCNEDDGISVMTIATTKRMESSTSTSSEEAFLTLDVIFTMTLTTAILLLVWFCRMPTTIKVVAETAVVQETFASETATMIFDNGSLQHYSFIHAAASNIMEWSSWGGGWFG
jgi:hypothetical protein